MSLTICGWSDGYDVSPTYHPIIDSIPSTVLAINNTYSTYTTSPGFNPLLTYISNRNIVGYLNYGTGLVIYNGFDYLSSNASTKKLAGNIMKWAATHSLAPYITSSPIFATVPPLDSTIINLTFDSNSLSAGIYSGSVTIVSNVDSTSSISIPYIFNVSGSPSINLSDTCLMFGNSLTNTPLSNNIWVYNTGCDTLFIDSVSTSSPFSVQPMSFAIAPFDSALINIDCLTTTSGIHNSTLNIFNNDVDTAICLNTISTIPPTISSNLDTIQVNLSCTETIDIPFTIYNTGDHPLIIHSGKTPLRILAYTVSIRPTTYC